MEHTSSQSAEIELCVYSLTDVSSGETLSIHLDRAAFDAIAGPHGALMVGSAQEIAEKLATQRELFGANRFIGLTDLGGLPRASVLGSIERFASDVAPVLRHESRSVVRPVWGPAEQEP